MNDPVNNPKHYEFYPDMDAIEVIRRTLSYQEYIGYLKGNALKYRLRAGDKGDTQQDIDKSNWYRKALRDVLPNESAQAVSADVTPECGEAIPEIPKGGETVIRKGLPENYFKALDACKSSEFEHTREESGDRIKPGVKFRRPIPLTRNSDGDACKSGWAPTKFVDGVLERDLSKRFVPEVTPEENEAWDEKRADIIGQNGNGGEHYKDQTELTLYIYNGHRIVGQAHNVGRCSNCGEVWICGEQIETTCPGKPCDHTSGLHSYSSTKEAQCIDCKEMLQGGDDAKLTQHKRKSGVGPDT